MFLPPRQVGIWGHLDVSGSELGGDTTVGPEQHGGRGQIWVNLMSLYIRTCPKYSNLTYEYYEISAYIYHLAVDWLQSREHSGMLSLLIQCHD